MLRSTLTGLLITASAVVTAQTNQFHYFPENAAWRVDAMGFNSMGSGCDGENYYYHYVFGGDTVINAVSYRKVIRPHVEAIPFEGGPPCWLWYFPSFTGYLGAIREDASANKVFIIRPEQTNEEMLYDYNVLPGSVISSGNCTVVVETMDSVLIAGSYRWRWTFTDCQGDPGFIIAGIGQRTGLIEFVIWGAQFDSWLVCVRDDDTILLDTAHPSPFGCELITAIGERTVRDHGAGIYPVPCNDSFRFRDPNSIASAALIDGSGRDVMRIARADQPVDVSSLPIGWYTAMIIHKDATRSRSQLLISR